MRMIPWYSISKHINLFIIHNYSKEGEVRRENVLSPSLTRREGRISAKREGHRKGISNRNKSTAVEKQDQGTINGVPAYVKCKHSLPFDIIH